MKLNELRAGADIIAQMVMGKNTIEFHLKVVTIENDVIYTTPYLREGRPLELNVNYNPNVICNILGEDLYARKRVAWKNVKLETVKHDGRILYKISTMLFNRDSQSGERRFHERMLDEISGVVEDINGHEQVINIHDVSDNGISFYAAAGVDINHDRFPLHFEDKINNESFSFKLICKIVRVKTDINGLFFGCEVLDPPHDYLLYTFMFRLMSAN